MNRYLIDSCLASLLVLGACLVAPPWKARTQTPPVPPIITYQGGVALGGTAFHGIGHFKFAFVNREGDQTYWSNDGTSRNGAEPAESLPLVVYRGGYEVALGDTSLPHMTAVPAAVFTQPNVHVRVWFSDGTHTFQRIEPDQAVTSVGYAMVAASVPAGAIGADQLAAGAVTAGKLAPNAVTSLNIVPGSIGSAQLAANAAALNLQASGGLILSDQSDPTNLTQAGFTRIGTVQAEGEQWQQFSPLAPSPRTNAVVGWTGSGFMVWGGREPLNKAVRGGAQYGLATETWSPLAETNFPPAGTDTYSLWTGTELFVIASQPGWGRRYDPATATWRKLNAAVRASTDGTKPLLLWTGREILIWNGASGDRYDPGLDAVRPMSHTNLLGNPILTGVWTGAEMILFGGGGTKPGAAYNPVTDTWRPISAVNAPAGRYGHSAVWDGGEMIVWGGTANSGRVLPVASGARYNPATDTWRPISPNSRTPRSQHVAVWSGTEMVVLGGWSYQVQYQRVIPVDGGERYNPKTDTWQPVSNRGMPATLTGSSAVWTGSEVLIWGGTTLINGSPSTDFSNDGWLYRPATDSWRPVATSPIGRSGHSVVWTGKELIVWGGNSNLVAQSDTGTSSGARYNPAKGRWYPISTANAPSARWGHRAVWTGREMVVWGGEGLTNNSVPTTFRPGPLNTGGRYDPATDTWRGMDNSNAPLGRSLHAMVWSGTEVLIYGGRQASAFTGLAGGARYQPETDTWSSMATVGAPAARYAAVVAWTGREFIVWGGNGTNASGVMHPLTDGGRYNPILNAWQSMAENPTLTAAYPVGVWGERTLIVWAHQSGSAYDPDTDRWTPIAGNGPVSATQQSAAWTGKEMLVWSLRTPAGSPPGSRYAPATDGWLPMGGDNPPRFLRETPGVWTGDKLLAFGVVGIGPGLNTSTAALVSWSPVRSLSLYRYAGGTPRAAGLAAPPGDR